MVFLQISFPKKYAESFKNTCKDFSFSQIAGWHPTTLLKLKSFKIIF